jgi:hypothetical membrane protein
MKGERMSHPPQKPRTRALERWLACITIVGVATFAFLVLALHVLEPGFSPVHNAVSEYANGKFGALLAAAFILRGVASLALAAGLALVLAPIRWSWSGLLAFVLGPTRWYLPGVLALAAYGLASILAAIFPADPAGATPTLTGTAHLRMGTIAFVCIVAAALALAVAFTRDARWRAFGAVARALAALLLVELVVVVAVFITPHANVFGVVERIFAATVVVWLLAVARQVYRTAALEASRS